MQVTLQTWLRVAITIDVEPGTRAGTLKKFISQRLGTSTGDLVLVGLQHGRTIAEVEDHLSIEDLSIGGVLDLGAQLSATSVTKVRCVRQPNLPQRYMLAPTSSALLIFDFDDTIAVSGRVDLKMKAMLTQVKEAGHLMAIASYNRSAGELLRLAGIDSLFELIMCGFPPQTVSKADFVDSILGIFQSASVVRSVLFFDDQANNVRDVNNMEPKSVHGDIQVQAVMVRSPEDTHEYLSDFLQSDSATNSALEDLTPFLQATLPSAPRPCCDDDLDDALSRDVTPRAPAETAEDDAESLPRMKRESWCSRPSALAEA